MLMHRLRFVARNFRYLAGMTQTLALDPSLLKELGRGKVCIECKIPLHFAGEPQANKSVPCKPRVVLLTQCQHCHYTGTHTEHQRTTATYQAQAARNLPALGAALTCSCAEGSGGKQAQPGTETGSWSPQAKGRPSFTKRVSRSQLRELWMSHFSLDPAVGARPCLTALGRSLHGCSHQPISMQTAW